MKQAIKVIVPLLLGIAILFSIGWYFLEYDTDFTRDFLLEQARVQEENGNHRVAVWLYELAYRQSDDNDLVAIELAGHFKSIGNYAKAESTLSKAIEDGGSLELYIALCKTYVEQNKLMDAVHMLDQVSNPEIKAELSAMRPAVPKASSPSGFYSQYIQVSLEASSGTLYYSTDGEYPSLVTDAYTAPIKLSGGDTTVFALAVGENGLVSSPAVFSYTVGNVIEEVIFEDTSMETAIRELLNIGADRKIFSNELWNISEFTVPASAASCADLKWLPNLTSIVISNAAFPDLQVLGKLKKLETLLVVDSVISTADLKVIASLPKLSALALRGCSLSSIDALAAATELWYLDLRDNTIRDIGVLSNMKKLQALYISHNALVSLESIADLTGLMLLDVSYNSIVTTKPLQHLVNLTELDISANGLMKLEGMEKLTELTAFAAAHNKFVEVDALSACKKLKKLDVSHNHLLNIKVAAELPALEELNFSYNEVSSLPAFQAGSPMKIINGGYNQLSSLDNLAKLAKLEYIYMDYNSNVKSVNALVKCTALKVVNIYGTKVTNVQKLTDMGVLVNYKPNV